MKINREQLANSASDTLEVILVKGTNLFPKVKPDLAEIVDRVNVLTHDSLQLREPSDFFDVRLPVPVLDQVAQEHTRRARLVVATAGAGVGVAGLPGITVDIPILVASTVRLVRRQAVTYGFVEIEDSTGDPTPLLLALGASLGADLAINQVVTKVVDDIGLELSAKLVERFLVRYVSEAFAARILTSWLPRAVPIVGAITVAALDAAFLTLAGRRSTSYFRDRHQRVRQHILTQHIARSDWKGSAAQPTFRLAPPAIESYRRVR